MGKTYILRKVNRSRSLEMRKLFLFILPILLFGLGACAGMVTGSGQLVTQERTVSGITAVRLLTSGDLTIEQGAQESLTIQADGNIISLLSSNVSGGTLELSVQSLSGFSTVLPIKYTLIVKDISALTLMGSGDITAEGLSGDTVTITSMGSGDTKVAQLTARILNVVIDGSGNVNVSGGTSTDADVQVNGSGNFTAGNLKFTNATFHVLGSGSSETWVTGALNVNILGSGDVRYYGKPTLQQSILGSGNVISLGNK
jgi:hypothetical protein